MKDQNKKTTLACKNKKKKLYELAPLTTILMYFSPVLESRQQKYN